MNSTCGAAAARRPLRRLWAVLVIPLAAARLAAADPALPYPPQLQRDVNFWVRVYTRIDTNSGYLHDQYDLGVIYDTLHFAADTSPRERQRIVDRARDHYIAELRRIAAGRGPLSREDERIKALWGARATPERLLEATQDIRFQLGQANRFKAGLIRSGAWQEDIAAALKGQGLPPELAALPLVESSYNPRAYSKVGAAGLWQFMPSTGRRFMRIDRAVDDRMDPFIATQAAAQLLAYNHRILGTWPLALTAYNHGVAGVRRAVETMGTTNIVTIVRDYHTRSFGFASRNFYVSFLAALKVERGPQKYFGAIVLMRAERFREVRVPAYVNLSPLERVLDVEPETLRELNPALRRAVWDGRLAVPKGYGLRLPMDGPRWTTAMLVERLGSRALLASQPIPPSYRIRAGDTLSRIASLYRVSVRTLARLNDIRPSTLLRVGQRIDLPGSGGSVTAISVANAVPDGATGGVPTAAAQVVPGRPSMAVHVPMLRRGSPAAAAYYSRVSLTASQPVATATGTSVELADEPLPQGNSRFGLTGHGLLAFGGSGAGPTAVPGTDRLDPESGSSQQAGFDSRSEGEQSMLLRLQAGQNPQPADAEGAQPVSAAQADALSPALGPAGGSDQNADPTDYSIAANGTIRVAAAETLGHYAEWLGVSAADLRRINHLRFGRPVLIGHRIRLDFRHVSPQEFAARRREYHQTLEASYFAAHRIVGTEEYIAKRGDSLWTLTQRFSQLPLWLLRQYNPDTDFADLRPGTQVVVPRIEDLSAGG